MANKTTSKVSAKNKAIIVVSILLLVVVVGAIVMLTRKTASADNALEVWYNEERMTGESMIFPLKSELRFDLKAQDGITEYNVVIRPNVAAENDFVFTANGEEHKFSEEKNLTGGFCIEKHEDYFIFAINNGFLEILGTNYPEQIIECGEVDFVSAPLFVMEISVGENTVSIPFVANLSRKPTGVTLDKDNIVYEQMEDDEIE